ncbi:MAG: AraC family transcriptional regulator [Psychromonas sp.]|nr:AraC family transcriptional regulator [Alteromonadales bacterium]MCP5079677.1 AraC family transcriptional regulator [Psychromonas sp.]
MPANKTDYQQKLQPVIRYLESNFKAQLNLKEVAEKAFLSPYHFHRLFKAVTHETLADYLRRLKLEYAAQQLFYNEQSITEIALSLGFASSQSFAKAFRRHFGLCATEIRDCLNLNQYRILIKQSNIGHLLSNNGNTKSEQNGYSISHIQQVEKMMKNKMTIEKTDQKLLAYIRVIGPYGEGYHEASAKLYKWATQYSLAGGDSIYIYHDNPEITPSDKCRTDICISVPMGTTPPEGIELQTLPAGDYASLRQTITEQEQYASCWYDLMEQLVESKLTLDDRPCFELYHSYDCEHNIADVGFYTAINL